MRHPKHEDYLKAAIGVICELMRNAGLSVRETEKLLRQGLSSGFATSENATKEAWRISRLADVCARWHIESDFVGKDGQPKPLRWNGKSGTLMKLVRRVVGPKDGREVIRDLLSHRLLRQAGSGSWIPKSKVVAPAGFASPQVSRTATMLNWLLTTVSYNSRLRYKGDVLLEVMAKVPRLPLSEVSRFRKFSKAQGISFIKTIDDWLEARNLGRTQTPKRPYREVGVIAFAFMQEKGRTRRGPT
jgi:hypothetical protein